MRWASALKQQSASARQGASVGAESRGRSVLRARRSARARRLDRRARATHRSAPSRRRITPTRTTCWGSFSASREICLRPSVTSSARSRSSPTPPRPLQPRRRAVVQRLEGRALAELRESVRLDPAAGASQAFLGTALREHGDSRGAGKPAARDRAAAADRRGLRRSRHHVSARGRARQGAGAIRGRAEPPAAVAADARLGRRHRRTAPGARATLPAPRPTPAATGRGRRRTHLLGLLLGPQRRRQRRRRGGVSRGHSAAAGLRGSAQQSRPGADPGR